MEDHFPAFAGLKAFFAVGRSNGIAEAATRLGVSRSAISHQLKKLETELGVRLYERAGGKLKLTTEGEAFLRAIEGPMKQIREATEQIRSSPKRRRVSLTLTPSFAAGWLMPRMRKLSELHPELELNLICTTRVVELGTEHVDIAIRRGGGKWPGLDAVRLFREEVVPVISPTLLNEIDADDLASLLERAQVLVNENLPTEWDDWLSASDLNLASEIRRFVLESYELTLSACQDGLGVALGRRPLVDPLLDSGDLVQPFKDAKAGTSGYFLVSRKDYEPDSMARKLRAWLLAESGIN